MSYRYTIVFFCFFSFVGISQTYFEGFEDLNNLSDWYFLNNSDSPYENWGNGNTNNFNPYDGCHS